MIKEMIAKAVNRENLTEQEAASVMKEIMLGETTPAQIAAFLAALRMKKETIEEITGFAKTMREFVTQVNTDLSVPVIDTCGTGGDSTGTFNISTVAAFVLAGAGLKVAKHGNRSVTSRCGSADLMEALGVKLDMPVVRLEECLEVVGMAFLFAPLLHPSMKHAIVPRKEMGIRTVFNILGPLTNPASANCQVLGIYSKDLVEPLANVLKNLGLKNAFVAHGSGLDEITTTGETFIARLREGKVDTFTVTPEQFGMNRAGIRELAGEDVKTNLQILQDLLEGEKGPRRDVVLLNASAGLAAGGIAKNMEEGVLMAAEIIDSGKAMKKLKQFQKFFAVS